MALGWKWVAAIAVWLSYSAIVLVWLAWEFEIPLRPPRVTSFPPSDDELRHHFDNLRNSSWYSSSTVCKEYLLEGPAAAADLTNVDTMLDMFEWKGGEWFYPLESSNPNWSKQHRVLKVDAGDHDATFMVYQATDVRNGAVEWGNLTHPIQTIGGHLILHDFWDTENWYTGEEAGADIDYTQIRNLKILLLGAFVNTGVDRRVCMTGCAYRSDHSNQLDCEFVLKMKYPNRRTLTTRRIEAELSSARRVHDPLYFPAFHITGPNTVTESEYDFRSEEFLQTALNMSNGSDGNLDSPSTANPKDLVTYLEGSGEIYRAVIVPTLIEQTLFKQQGKVVVGPFSTPYYTPQEVDFPADLAAVELTLKFKNIVTRASNVSGRVLVSGSMKIDISWSQMCTPQAVEQRPFSVEGIWDTMSEELCMIGCRVDSLNPNLRQNYNIPDTSCDWKICIQSVLRRHVSIDSPLEGAVLSSLYGDAHFTPLGFLRGAAIYYFPERPDMEEITRVASLTTYAYTVAAKAEDLAREEHHRASSMSRSLEELDKRWFHPRYPTPYDVADFCKATHNMRSALLGFGMSLLYDKEGRPLDVHMDGRILYVESCPENYSFDYLDRLPEDTTLKTPTPGSYLKLAVQLSIFNIGMSYQAVYPHSFPPWQCGAEGVYEPYTGKMHLVVHLKHRYMDGVQKELVAASWPLQRTGGGDAEVEDHEIYMKLQFPSIDRTMSSAEEEALDPDPQYSHQGEYGHRCKVDMSLESLRSASDPLYFAPFMAKSYPLYKPS